MAGFDRPTALANCQRLVAHANSMFKELYVKYADTKDYLPMRVMFRCFALARCLILYELAAIISPEEVTVDPLELFQTQGGFLFNAFCGPKGDAFFDLAAFAHRYTTSSNTFQ